MGSSLIFGLHDPGWVSSFLFFRIFFVDQVKFEKRIGLNGLVKGEKF